MESGKSDNYGKGLKFFQWQEGRAAGGYRIFPMLWVKISERFGFDCFLLDYQNGSKIEPHRDGLHSFPDLRHYRLNTKIWHRGSGGEFICESILWKLGPIICFRPDINTHSVTEVKGRRIMLSIGWKI